MVVDDFQWLSMVDEEEGSSRAKGWKKTKERKWVIALEGKMERNAKNLKIILR